MSDGFRFRFKTNKLITSLPAHPYQFVELQVYCLRITSLAVLDDEHHDERKHG